MDIPISPFNPFYSTMGAILALPNNTPVVEKGLISIYYIVGVESPQQPQQQQGQDENVNNRNPNPQPPIYPHDLELTTIIESGCMTHLSKLMYSPNLGLGALASSIICRLVQNTPKLSHRAMENGVWDSILWPLSYQLEPNGSNDGFVEKIVLHVLGCIECVLGQVTASSSSSSASSPSSSTTFTLHLTELRSLILPFESSTDHGIKAKVQPILELIDKHTSN